MSLLTMRTTNAVYWAPGAPDGFGGETYATPVDIKCRIQVRSHRPPAGSDNSFTTDTIVYTDRAVGKGGWIWEGTVATLINVLPQQCTGALRIKDTAQSSTPDVRYTIYKAII